MVFDYYELVLVVGEEDVLVVFHAEVPYEIFVCDFLVDDEFVLGCLFVEGFGEGVVRGLKVGVGNVEYVVVFDYYELVLVVGEEDVGFFVCDFLVDDEFVLGCLFVECFVS